MPLVRKTLQSGTLMLVTTRGPCGPLTRLAFGVRKIYTRTSTIIEQLRTVEQYQTVLHPEQRCKGLVSSPGAEKQWLQRDERLLRSRTETCGVALSKVDPDGKSL
jgi:hypothetical protein